MWYNLSLMIENSTWHVVFVYPCTYRYLKFKASMYLWCLLSKNNFRLKQNRWSKKEKGGKGREETTKTERNRGETGCQEGGRGSQTGRQENSLGLIITCYVKHACDKKSLEYPIKYTWSTTKNVCDCAKSSFEITHG